MSEFKVGDMLNEISDYDIKWDNAIDFVLQKKGRSNDLAFFYYKSSLLQLLKCRHHLDSMLAIYYGVEDSSLIKDKIVKIYEYFIQGNNEVLMRMFKEAKCLEDNFCRLNQSNSYNFYRASIPKTIQAISKKINELDCLVERKCIELENLKEEKDNSFESERIKGNIKTIDNQIKVIIEELERYFKEVGAIVLLAKLNFVEAMEEELDWDVVCERFTLRFSNYYEFVRLYHFLIEDLVFSSKVIKEYSKIVDMINKTKDLKKVCLFIGQILLPTKKQEFRTEKLIGDNFMKYTTPPENVLDDFNKLMIQFRGILEEQDIDIFIKRCADFHFDFLRVHPFNDGNGRISRILLSTMFLTRNIMLPTLYYNDYDKVSFYINSDKALNGDYSNIEQELFIRLGHYYPSAMLDARKFKK